MSVNTGSSMELVNKVSLNKNPYIGNARVIYESDNGVIYFEGDANVLIKGGSSDCEVKIMDDLPDHRLFVTFNSHFQDFEIDNNENKITITKVGSNIKSESGFTVTMWVI